MATPEGPLEICFSFDTTGYMINFVHHVKARLQDMVQRLKSDIPGIKLALFAHGDYYYSKRDNKSDYVYVTKFENFTDDVAKLCECIQLASLTNSGDWKECYELVLWEARVKLAWSRGANKVMVIIGDAIPHEVDAPVNTSKIDWKKDVQQLLDKGVRTYGVFCQTPSSHDYDLAFYKDLAKRGQGDFLTLTYFDSIFDFMMAICYREKGEDALQAYEKEVLTRRHSTSREVIEMFTTLKKSASNASTSSASSIPKAATAHAQTAKAATGKARATKTQKAKKATPKPRSTRPRAAKTRAATKAAGKKTVAKKGPVKGAASKPKRMVGTAQVKPQRRLRRELVPQTNFGLREYRWSAWKPVMCSYGMGPYWRARKKTGYARNWFFTSNTRMRALYEFAVQIRPGLQKTVVYSKLSDGFPMDLCWERKLFKFERLRSQIDKLLEKKFTIHVRRLLIGSQRMHDKVVKIHKVYDYAWDINDDTGKSREIVKKGEIVSFEQDSR